MKYFNQGVLQLINCCLVCGCFKAEQKYPISNYNSKIIYIGDINTCIKTKYKKVDRILPTQGMCQTCLKQICTFCFWCFFVRSNKINDLEPSQNIGIHIRIPPLNHPNKKTLYRTKTNSPLYDI